MQWRTQTRLPSYRGGQACCDQAEQECLGGGDRHAGGGTGRHHGRGKAPNVEVLVVFASLRVQICRCISVDRLQADLSHEGSACCRCIIPLLGRGISAHDYLRRSGIRARDLLEDAAAAEATLCVHAVRPAAQLAHLASLVPIIPNQRLSAQWESALVLRRLDRSRAWNVLEGHLSAEAAFSMKAVRHAAELAHAALGVPIVGNGRLVGEAAHL
mmetsp:Transcript_75412/g.190714  ORF Transcript_75412/g.190714 Transcript_75412/m.190714 type:complete len:214 (+) Transcript_75412:180-821(+)